MTDTTCKVAALGVEFAAMVDAMNASDAAAAGAKGAEREKHEARTHALHVRATELQRYSSFMEPTSPLGVLFLLNQIGEYLDEQASDGDENAEAILRMAYAVRTWVEAQTGEDADKVAADYMMGRHLDPHAMCRVAC